MANDEKDAYDQMFLLALWCNFVIFKVRLLVKNFRQGIIIMNSTFNHQLKKILKWLKKN